MNKFVLLFLFSTSFIFSQKIDIEKTKINSLIDSWHKAAAEAKFETYFDLMDEGAIFIGTDASENWKKNDFKSFAKPHFDKGKAWSFTSLERHIYFSKDKKTAWFDELLDTQMKICRGSGVVVKTKNGWKISHYVLSMTIPNDNSSEIIKIKAPIEDALIDNLRK